MECTTVTLSGDFAVHDGAFLEKLKDDQPAFGLCDVRVSIYRDGPGGTGKTFLYLTLLANIKSRGMIALAFASSGVAATILPGGCTTHSRFEIPLQANETTITNMCKQGGGGKLIRQAKLIIWDEAPMAKRHIIETVDRSFRDIMDNNAPFSGKVMIFGGDFRQVLSVVPKSTRAKTVNASLVRSYLCTLMEKIHLTSNMRARADSIFCEFLLRVENIEESTIRDNLIQLPQQMMVQATGDSKLEECLVRKVFPSLQQNYRSSKYITERAILANRNEYVDNLNEMLITQFPGKQEHISALTRWKMIPTISIKKNS
ncbi:hypothetical protein H5410_022686 [Solanum commersonii]|uniref:ATP-dependent DNA helicase n=1 Tax=Solanum commersonii TaxID=4109 RepID=A0A9J5ZG51_SOLCO|nr:hypothetical protein H5410_022686 [Solanum commersonii]